MVSLKNHQISKKQPSNDDYNPANRQRLMKKAKNQLLFYAQTLAESYSTIYTA